MKIKKADKLPNMHNTTIRGIPVIIEWPKGSTRVGKRKDGSPFKTEMKADYGYIPDTVAAGDQEKLDVYIGSDPEAETVYVVEQVRKGTWDFDEYKIMLNFSSLEAAEEMYNYHIGDDADVELDDIAEIPFDYLFDKVVGDPEKAEKKVADHQDEKLSVIDAFIKLYKHEVDFYEECASQAAETLEDALTEAGIRAIVTYRAKKPRKLRTKLQNRDQKRHYQSFREIYDDIVDLAGVRVALYLPADRDAVGALIEQKFASVREPKNFPEDRGPGDGMGYVATHYLVQLRPETLHKEELRYADTNIEIQVASVLMHAWAEVTHDLLYKPEKGNLTPEEMKMIEDLNKIVQQGEATLEQLQESVEARNNGTELRFELSAALTKIGEKLAAQSKGTVIKRISAGDVLKLAENAISQNLSGELTEYLKAIGWQHRGFNEWAHPNQPQTIVQVYRDGWIQRSWDKIESTGDTLMELQKHLGQTTNQPHTNYLKARMSLWKAHKADEMDDRLRDSFKKNEMKPVGDMNRVQTVTSPDAPFIDAAKTQLGIALDAHLTGEQISQVLALAQDLKTNRQP